MIQHRKRARPKTVTIDPVRVNKRFFLPVYKDPTATPEALGPLPATYGECQEARRGTKEVPCTYLRCKHHMATNVREGKERPGKPRMATINVIHPRADEPYVPDLAVFSHTCVLAFVDDMEGDAPTPYTVIAELLGCTQQRIQHIVDHALRKLEPGTAAIFPDD